VKAKPTKAQRAESKANFGRIWDDVMPEAFTASLKYLRESKKKAPPRLLHFTDAKGVAGILSDQVLHLARARSSTDSSELRYGLGVGRECLARLSRRDDWTRIFQEEVGNCWDGLPFYDVLRPIPDPHISCFAVATSRNENSIVHWSMYGQSGSGIALVFDGRELARRDNVDLVKVIYEPSRQRALLTTALLAGFSACVRGRMSASQYGARPSETMFRTLSHAVGSLTAIAAAAMKSPEFRIEDEWRLVVSYLPVQLSAEQKKKQLPLVVRASGHSLKSYYQLPITPKDLRGVVIGPALRS
jgi:hypothetical protein